MHVHVQASCTFHEQLGCLTTPKFAEAYAQPEKYECLTNLCGIVPYADDRLRSFTQQYSSDTDMERGLAAQSC